MDEKIDMSFTDEVWLVAGALLTAIKGLPFNVELTKGSLPQDKFQHYMLQDSLYLETYSRVLSIASAKAPTTDMMLEFSVAAQDALVVERALHEGFFRSYGLDQDIVVDATPSPTCLNYTNFLLATAHNASFEETVSAILPCFWVYWDVGLHIAERANPNNPYQAWIDTYSDDQFADSVKRIITITDRLALAATPAVRERMRAAFMQCTRFEWMFWDSAYRLEEWPV
jgi:thiaminase/transcriptional activator TenA